MRIRFAKYVNHSRLEALSGKLDVMEAALAFITLTLFISFVAYRKAQRVLRKWNRFWRPSRKPKRRHDFFYESEQWQVLRRRALKTYGCLCMKCGAANTAMHVDHIKPRSRYPKLELEFENLQVLCGPCNMKKSNKNTKDYRGSRRAIARRYANARFQDNRKAISHREKP